MGGGGELGFGVEEAEDAFGGGHGGLEDVVFVGQVLDGAEEALGVLNKRDEDAERNGAEEAEVREPGAGKGRGASRNPVVRGDEVEVFRLQDGPAAEPKNKGDGDGGEELDYGVIEGVGEDGVGPG